MTWAGVAEGPAGSAHPLEHPSQHTAQHRATPLPPAALVVLAALVMLAHGWLLSLPWGQSDGAAGARPVPAQRAGPVHVRTLAPSLHPPQPARPASKLAHTVTPAQTRMRADKEGVAAAGPQPEMAAEPAARSDPATRVPGPAVLAYGVTGTHRGQPYGTQAELHWSHDSATYTARLAMQAAPAGPAARVQTSTGTLDASGLQPTRYGQRGHRAEEATHFDHAGGRIVFSRNAPPVPLPPRAQDPLSAVLQVGALLAAAAHPPTPGDTLTLPTASTLELRPWVFRVEAAQAVELKGQAMQTWWLSRAPTGEHDARLDIWLAPALGWLPVRWRSTLPGGDFTEHLLHASPPSP